MTDDSPAVTLDEVEAKDAEIARLREALEAIAEGDGIDFAHKPTSEMQDIARAALAHAPPPQS